MKTKLMHALLAAALLGSSVGYADICSSCDMEIRGLSQTERDRIWNEIHFCIKKMNIALNNAEREASKITDVDVEQATRAAISGAIGGLATRNVYGVVITSCLNTLGQIAGDSYYAFRRSRDYVKDAEYYAYRADELQEKLWRDE